MKFLTYLFYYSRDVVTEEEAIEMLKKDQSRKEERKKILESKGHPAYTADIGWWSFNNQQLRSVCKKFKKLEFKEYKTCVGPTISVSWKKCNLMRNVVGKGSDKILIVDANQFWDKPEAIFSVKGFNQMRPYCIEEPTSPDDALGHVAIRDALKELKYPVRVSCGETCANRVLFKQFLKFGGVDFWNINVGRLGGVNEALAVYFMAKKHSSKFVIIIFLDFYHSE